jgi:hypothetical protein
VAEPTCNHPLNFRSSHPPVCGKPAVARLRISVTGLLTDLFACEEHRIQLDRHGYLKWEDVK